MLRLTAIFHLLVFSTQLCSSKQVHFDVPHEYPASTLDLQLRHYHAVTDDARILFHDIQREGSPDSIQPPSSPLYTVHTKRTISHRPLSAEGYLHARSLSIRREPYQEVEWEEDDIIAPDVSSRLTLLELAKMTNNAYLDPGEAGWYDLEGKWNVVSH